MPKKYICKQIN